MTTLRLPGLVDVHVHTRDPGQTHKEDWSTATAAALAGGFTTVLAMPNTEPAAIDEGTFENALSVAAAGARCDWGQYVGAGEANAAEAAALAPRAAGLKMYLDQTFGDLRLGDLSTWWDHLETWPHDRPLAVHAEQRTLGTALFMAKVVGRPIHVCHVSRADEIEMIRRARDAGQGVTCEVAPHHLVLDGATAVRLGSAAAVRPPLASEPDRKALWEHLEAIDCFATDHAPHTAAEKGGRTPPPGFPGLETALPLLVEAIHDGRLSTEGLVDRLWRNPHRIFGLPEQPDTHVEVDVDTPWEVRGSEMHSRAGWTPFEGFKVRGRVTRVVLRGQEAFIDGEVTAVPGTGRDVRAKEDA
jgi:carbamoyl-phosphate synthase/aspartate carbamoyltransferase/dihydroorotase